MNDRQSRRVTKRFDAECEACRGTGLYQGIAERGGLAVECKGCSGSGRVTYKSSYVPFAGRNPPPDGVTHVIGSNPGYILDPAHAGSAAISLSEWSNGRRFTSSQMRHEKRQCPAQYVQNTMHVSASDLPTDCGFGMFTECKHYPKKDECWKTAEIALIQIESKSRKNG